MSRSNWTVLRWKQGEPKKKQSTCHCVASFFLSTTKMMEHLFHYPRNHWRGVWVCIADILGSPINQFFSFKDFCCQKDAGGEKKMIQVDLRHICFIHRWGINHRFLKAQLVWFGSWLFCFWVKVFFYSFWLHLFILYFCSRLNVFEDIVSIYTHMICFSWSVTQLHSSYLRCSSPISAPKQVHLRDKKLPLPYCWWLKSCTTWDGAETL